MNKRRQDRRQELIQAAKEFINEQGYEKLTVRALCDRVDLAPSAFYYIFESRDALILAISDEIDTHFQGLEDEILAMEPTQALEAFCTAYLTFVQKQGVECNWQMHACRRTDPQTYERSRDRAATRLIWNILEKGKRKGVFIQEDTQLLFDWVMLFLRGQSFDWARYSGAYDLLEAGRRKFPLLLRAFRSV